MNAASRLSHSHKWFQLAKIWLTNLRANSLNSLAALSPVADRNRTAIPPIDAVKSPLPWWGCLAVPCATHVGRA
jgi:hypothetical protein